MAFTEPVPTYAEVAFSQTDPKSGKTKHEFNPAWLSWFLSLTKSIGTVDLSSGGITGVLPAANGGTGVDISTYFSGTVPLAKITVGGTDGSLTVVEGLITAVVAPG